MPGSNLPTPSAEPEDDVIEVMARAEDQFDADLCGVPLSIWWRILDGSATVHADDLARAERFREDRMARVRAALSASGLLERERVLEGLRDGLKIAGAVLRNAAAEYGCEACAQAASMVREHLDSARTALSNPLKAD